MTDTYMIKGRTPLHRGKYCNHEQLGNEIHIEVYITEQADDDRTEIKVFTFTSEQEARQEYNDIEQWMYPARV